MNIDFQLNLIHNMKCNKFIIITNKCVDTAKHITKIEPQN